MRQSLTLQSLVYRNFLRSSLIPLLVIELLLLSLYFGINLYISEKNRSTLITEVTQSLREITTNEATRINEHLQEVSRNALLLQQDHQLFFNSERCFLPNGQPEFARHANGALYKTTHTGASLYYSSSTVIGEQEHHKALCSESLDPLLKAIVDTNASVTQAYLNTWDNMNRIYPFMEDAPSQYGPVLNMKEFNFYYEADQEHNPTRGPVWTDVYLDPAGQGWMVSNLVPIYRGDFLEGVTGLDVTVESFVETILSYKFPWQSATLVVDGNGTILAMQQSAEQLLGIRELKHHKYSEHITDTITKPDDFNLFSLKALQRDWADKLYHSDSTLEIKINNADYIADSKRIAETDWRVITFINTNSFLVPIDDLKQFSDHLGYLAVLVMILFYIVFFLYLNRKSRKLAAQISHPIEALTNATSTLGKQWDIDNLVNSSIKEIQTLNQNFQSLVDELESRNNKLVESTIQIRIQVKEKELLARIAETDSLTGIANRFKLDKVMHEAELQTRKAGSPYGLILLDIDNFKKINDNQGHQLGDQVLQEIATLLTEAIAETDIVGRWGGEEFLIVCREAKPERLYELAEQLRDNIHKHRFPQVGTITASFGLALYQTGDDIKHLLARADNALYQAKRNGRNKVVCGN